MAHGKNNSKSSASKNVSAKTTSENAKVALGNIASAYLPGKAHGKALSKVSSTNKKISHKVASDVKVSSKHTIPSKSSFLLSPKKVPIVSLVHKHLVETVRTASVKKSPAVNPSQPKVPVKVSSVGKAVSSKTSKSKTSKASSSKVVVPHSVGNIEGAAASALAEMGRF